MIQELSVIAENMPDEAYRVFDKFEFREQFRHGIIRFGNIYNYRKTDDYREDKTEGLGMKIIQGTKTSSFPMSNRIYILCFHLTKQAANEAIKKKMKEEPSDYCILKIKNINRFAKDIVSVMNNLQLTDQEKIFPVGLQGCEIEYTKGDLIEYQPSNVEKHDWIWCQKPPEYISEEEYRVAIFLHKKKEEYLRKKYFLFEDKDKKKHLNIYLANPLSYFDNIKN